MKQHIPNLATLFNLCSGCIAVILVLQGALVWGAFFVMLGIVFDFLDGFLARILNAQSELGLQLDSLADMVTSGVVPGLVMYMLIATSLNLNTDFFNPEEWSDPVAGNNLRSYLPFVALLVPMASAYRLGKFNLDTEQQSYFKGLPTPANTLLIMSFPLILEYQNNDQINSVILNPYLLIGLCVLSAYLLNAPFKLFALKFKSFDFSSNALKYILIICSVIGLIVFKYAAVPLIIVFYILLSLINQRHI